MQLKEIKNITARKVWDSKGNPTLAVTIKTSKGTVDTIAPQGTSKGKHEVRDFSVRGLDFSINFINVFGKKLINMPLKIEMFSDLEDIETQIQDIDSNEDLHIVGGNAIYALEASLLKAAAQYYEFSLWKFLLGKRKKIMPRPLGNVIGGGMHTRQENKTDYQEFLLLPKTKHFFDAVFINEHAHKLAKTMLLDRDKAWNRTVTDENAFATTLANRQVLDMLLELKDNVKKEFDVELGIGVDMASTHLWNGLAYVYKNYPSRNAMTKEEQLNYAFDLIKRYNLVYVEDPFQEEDFKTFSRLQTRIDNIKHNCLLTGDDLTCTNPERIEKAIKEKAISGLIIKPNQIGSLIKMKQAVDLAKKNKIVPVISHRSGETQDNTIADLCVGFQIPLIKAGIAGKERVAKLNRLIHIEKEN